MSLYIHLYFISKTDSINTATLPTQYSKA